VKLRLTQPQVELELGLSLAKVENENKNEKEHTLAMKIDLLEESLHQRDLEILKLQKIVQEKN
jgi:hypothetical protein